MPDDELARAVHGETMTVVLQGVTAPLRPLVSAIRPVHAYLVCTSVDARTRLRLLR
jgi:hypothetical protein